MVLATLPVAGPATTLSTGSPATNLATCSRTSRCARGKNADELPPTCGEMRTPGARPQRMVAGQRFGVGDVESRAQPTTLKFDQQRVGVDDAAARNVDQQRAVPHRCEELASTRCRVDGVNGVITTTTSACGSSSGNSSTP